MTIGLTNDSLCLVTWCRIKVNTNQHEQALPLGNISHPNPETTFGVTKPYRRMQGLFRTLNLRHLEQS